MRILLVGSGGREAALAWALSKGRNVERIFVAPGNAGTAQVAENVPIGSGDIDKLCMFAWCNHVDLVVVGPEVPLEEGIADQLQNMGIPVFGPSKRAAQIESSKIFCKELLLKYGIPTARFRAFDDPHAAHKYAARCRLPVVIKADGLCQGKGVVVAKDRTTAHQAIEDMMVVQVFKEAGKRIVVEEFLVGKECSLHVLCDGENMIPLLPSRDYKEFRGKNTGGMGGYAPVPDFTQELQEYCMEHIIRPTFRALAKEGISYRGALYAGLMLTEDGPKVLEFNCRLGDPETQIILPLLESDLSDLLMASSGHFPDNSLKNKKIQWSQKRAVCLNLVSQGYPGKYRTGKQIKGLEEAAHNPNVLLFHAGTDLRNGKIVTCGGRVLSIVAVGRDFAEARADAYITASKISFPGKECREDIALF